MRWDYKEGLNVVFLQEGVPLLPISWLHLIVTIQALQRGASDVHFPIYPKRESTTLKEKKIPPQRLSG